MRKFDKYDDDFETAPVGGGASTKDKIPDGEYVAVVESVTDKELGNQTIVSLKLKILTDGPAAGSTFDHDYWLSDKQGKTNEITMSQLKADLTALGFQADQWKQQGRKFGTELPRVLLVLPGVRVQMKKSTKEKDKKTYHNVYLNKRGAEDGKPPTFDAATLAELAEAAKPADPFA